MGHRVEAVMEELNCEPKHVEPWLALARGKIPEDGLTDHLAASVAAAVTLRRKWPNAGERLDRLFVKLAFYTPPKDDWVVVRLPRKPAQIIDRGEFDIDRARKVGYVTVFDPKAFLQGLKRRRAEGR